MIASIPYKKTKAKAKVVWTNGHCGTPDRPGNQDSDDDKLEHGKYLDHYEQMGLKTNWTNKNKLIPDRPTRTVTMLNLNMANI